jgi:hypothetical protein
MPKWYKPQLNQAGSVWLEPSAEMARELSANKENVLGKLRFHCAHGRPEDFDGKFKDQVRTHEKEVLAEIVGVLTLAASLSVKLQRGVLIATLEKVLLAGFDFRTHISPRCCLVPCAILSRQGRTGNLFARRYGRKARRLAG